ncbi:response regulator transcription factor [Spirosoma foliorum]|uniref:Response regulator transcription factor n=1 Tax=Spirosoma foliorum TaxID=2710596 RepID=A0A7G5H1B6_9BACT|nr:response regulator transcription factor [Spirosoma foliorum]QMW04908.1 response regulator transcription factor [Spirosoma foliorum]
MLKKILLIEDVAQIRENVAEQLILNGYDVRTAEDGVTGLIQAKQWLPNLILCDIMMGNMNGYQVLENIRENPETAHIPFIFLTAKADMVHLREGMELGADDYVTKPFLLRDLLNAIESRLKRSQEQQVNSNLSNTYLKSIRGRDSKGCMVLRTEECIYFGTHKRGYFVYHPLGNFQIGMSLDTLIAKLNPDHFFRVNRHVILHRKSIQKYAYWDKGKHCLMIDVGGNPQEVILPKARYRSFKDWLAR